MYKEICKRLLLSCVAGMLLPVLMFSQEPEKEVKPQKKVIDLRIQVTGGEESTPLKSATIYIEWKEEGETKSRQGITNSKGIAGPYPVPQVKVFIQVTTKDNEWEPRGGDFDLKEQSPPIKINLTRRMHP